MPRIEALYAYVVADKDEDDEGVPAFLNNDGFWMPLMGADLERMQFIRKEAQRMANKVGKPIKLIRSTGIEVIDVVEPEA